LLIDADAVLAVAIPPERFQFVSHRDFQIIQGFGFIQQCQFPLGSRRKRIAAGSGTRVQDVNKLLKQFGEMRKMMKKMKKLKGKGGMPSLPSLGGMGLPKMPFFK